MFINYFLSDTICLLVYNCHKLEFIIWYAIFIKVILYHIITMLNIMKQFRNATFIDFKNALFYNIEYLKY